MVHYNQCWWFEFGYYPLSHGSLGIIRSLGRLGVPMYAITEHRRTPAAVSKYLSGAFVWNNATLDEQSRLGGMGHIGRQLKRRAILIPTDDLAAIFISDHADHLCEWFDFPPQVPNLARRVANKSELYAICEEFGVPCPRTSVPCSLEQLREFTTRIGFPVVAKVSEPWMLQEGFGATMILPTLEKAIDLFRRASTALGSDILFQEYIDPDGGENWLYNGYRNGDSGCCVSFTGRKLRSHPPLNGSLTMGRPEPNDELRQLAEDLLGALSYNGVVDLDFRRDSKDGKYKLLDFNPRIGNQFRLFEDENKLDVARALYHDLTGGRVRQSPTVRDRLFIVDQKDVIASAIYIAQRTITINQWLNSLKGPKQFAWWDRSDVAPFNTMCLGELHKQMTRALPFLPRHQDVSTPELVDGRGLNRIRPIRTRDKAVELLISVEPLVGVPTRVDQRSFRRKHMDPICNSWRTMKICKGC